MSATLGVDHVQSESPSSVSTSAPSDQVDGVTHSWLEHRLEVAQAQNLVAAAERSFDAVRGVLGFEQAALLGFDGELAEILADTHETKIDQQLHDEGPFIAALDASGDGYLGLPVAGTPMLAMLGVRVGGAVPVSVEGALWGALVVWHSGQHSTELSASTRSMLDSLASTLGVVAEREVTAQRLRDSNQRLSAYAHEAAHDLRSPLRRMRTFSDLLQTQLEANEIDRGQANDFAERIANGAERLDQLLVSMLEAAKTDPSVTAPNEQADA